MTVQVGDTIPDVSLTYVPYNPDESLQACPVPIPYNLHKELKGKKAVIVAVPGAFTPTCSLQHIPGFVEKADELKKKGVDVILGTAVNDGFVMNAWAKTLGTKDKVILASEGGSGFYEKLGLTQDLTARGMGIRSKRFALIVDDLKVTYVGVETTPDLTVSGVDDVLAAL
ncbi:Redoxin [Hesseltinella vesiculosa]|uniref:Thioredoxin-dependent peroxiredoxin n=1 Tax=Hesseltinella vesiculosa TaxID=101127 RepID=A0A1X2G684_9FUNG|nr:Redoxin [Hesseltinella vesiculosa]